ncbi:MAG: hypothetical protein WA775_05715 [Psychroserpens sp.]|uniref:hypothetical protein n=1 Tax=Psychroserpens sp. TaxID=2020870 RepID=UPI003CC1DDBE
MKKNILGAVVAFFVTVAFLIVVNDIRTNVHTETEFNSVDVNAVKGSSQTQDLATVDEEE